MKLYSVFAGIVNIYMYIFIAIFLWLHFLSVLVYFLISRRKTLGYIILKHYLGNLVMVKSIFSRGLGNSIAIHLATARLSCGVEYRIGHGAPAPATPLPHADSAYSYRVHIKTVFRTKKSLYMLLILYFCLFKNKSKSPDVVN